MTQGELTLSRARGAKAQKRITAVPSVAHENTINFYPNARTQQRTVELRPKTLGQERLILDLLDDSQHIVVATGPAGTGKTYLAMLAAIRALKAGNCERLILTRPAVGVEDERHGFLPGDINQKMEPWTRPLFDVMREYYHPRDITRMLDDGVIEISPLAYMRGRTFKNAWIVADEMQNATPAQMKMLLSRIGEESKIIVTGDVEQADRRANQNGLLDLYERLKTQRVNGLSLIEMSRQDIQRHPIIESVLEMYSDI